MELEKSFLKDIYNILSNSRARAVSSVNAEMIDSYWQIGKRIVQEEQQGASRADYAAFLIPNLSKQLTTEFGKGFSVANLKNFRQFYQTFPNGTKSYRAGSLSWSHFRLIMRIDNPAARNWYIREAATQNWSTTVLERNISTLYYDRLLSAPQKAEIVLTNEPAKFRPAEFVKDPYFLEFLNIPNPANFLEADLETNILNHLQHFLLELGKGFAFIGRQYHMASETSHFYLDLVFYNYLLKSFVLFDLKTGKLAHQDVGQMDMYVRMFDDLKKAPGDGPTIGIILCSDKDETIVKYSVLNQNDRLFASKYRIYLPTEKELIEEIQKEKLLSDKRTKP